MEADYFNPNGVGLHNGSFIGLPFTEEQSTLVFFPVPWDVTVSFGGGTSSGPKNILRSSAQLDLYDADYPGGWKNGIYFKAHNKDWYKKSKELRVKAIEYIEFLEEGGDVSLNEKMDKIRHKINDACIDLHDWVEQETGALIDSGKLIGLVGGDHSTNLGYIRALAARHAGFGILHIDAHMDLRESYEGFSYSHASAFHNIMQIPKVTKVVQVGIRDYCDEEIEFAIGQANRIKVYTEQEIQDYKMKGGSYESQVDEIIANLPQSVYISFDIDGLDPALCPNTGTPVPGGLQFAEATFLLRKVVESGRKIIGFDLVETAGGSKEWDGNVAARILYKMGLLAMKSNMAASANVPPDAKPKKASSARAKKPAAKK